MAGADRGPRHGRVLLFLALLAAALWLGRGQVPSITRAAAVEPAVPRAPAAFRVLGAAAPPEMELPVRLTRERGALRVAGAEAHGALELVLVEGPGGVGLPEVRRPDFVGTDFAEFYGLDAGENHVYWRSAGSSTDLERLPIPRGGLLARDLPPASAGESRRMVVTVAGQPLLSDASVLLDLGGAQCLVPWRGAPVRLDPPLARPVRAWVRVAPDESLAVARAGALLDALPREGPLVLDLPEGRAVVMTRRVPEAAAARSTGTAVHRISVAGGRRTKDLLAVVGADRFTLPPVLTTLAEGGARVGGLTVHGLEPGEARVGVGAGPGPTALLWRATQLVEERALEVLHADAPGPAAGGDLDSALEMQLLPPRLVPRADPASELLPRPGRVAVATLPWSMAAGPRERWMRRAAGGMRSAVLVGLAATDPQGVRARGELAMAHVSLPPLPADGFASVRAELFVPGEPDRHLALVELGREAQEPLDLGELPDGKLAARARVAGASFSLAGFIVAGELHHGGWTPLVPSTRAQRGSAVQRVELPRFPPGATAVVEGHPHALVLEPDLPPGLLWPPDLQGPLMLHVRTDAAAFDRHVVVTPDGRCIEVELARGGELGWAQLVELLGFEPRQLGITRIDLALLPRGETAALTTDAAVRLPAAEECLIEGRGVAGNTRLWCWIPAGAAATTPATVAGSDAALLHVSALEDCEVLVATSMATLRVRVSPERSLAMTLRAPLALAVARAGREVDEERGRSVGAQLEIGDVLTVHFD